MSLDWPTLQKLLYAGDTDAVIAAVVELDDKQRRVLAKPLREYAKRYGNDPTWALRAALAGCLLGAGAVAATLRRYDVWLGDPEGYLMRVLRCRSQVWLEELARRMAERVQSTDGYLGELTVALVTETGMDPPATFGFAFAWVHYLEGWHLRTEQRPGLMNALRADPLLPHALPLLFEPDELGTYLARPTQPPWPDRRDWPAAIATLAEEGRLDRSAILDACIGRLLRGGTGPALRAYVQIYQALRVTVDEAAERVPDLVPLLPDSSSTVAGLAQVELRRVDQAGRLGADLLVEACRAVLFRPEKKLVAAQLSWVDASVKNCPDRAGELLATVTVAFGHPAPDVQQKAVRLLEKHVRHLDNAARDQAVAAADGLPPDLRAGLTQALGPPAPLAAPAVPGDSPRRAPFSLAPLPAPLGSPAELAEEVAAVLECVHADTVRDVLDPLALERMLAGLVAFNNSGRLAMAAALAPVMSRWQLGPGLPDRLAWDNRGWWGPRGRDVLGVVVAAAVGRPRPDRPAGWFKQVAVLDKRFGPVRILLHRMAEIAIGLATRPVPLLLATPTAVTGRLDPAVLLARLEQAARQGWQPWEYDLQQALLRLPAELDPQLAVAARRLGTAAGVRLADWVEHGGLVVPALQRSGVTLLPRILAGTGAAFEIETVLVDLPPQAAAPAPAGSLVGMLVELPDPRKAHSVFINQHEWAGCWPMVAPSHRDLIAAHLLRAWLPRAYGGDGLPLLAEADGAVGPAMHLAIAGGLSADSEASRMATVDGLVILDRRGQLDGAAVGRDIAALTELGDVKLGRVVQALRDTARAGAESAVWDTIRAALPPLLTAALRKPATGLADLVALGTELAGAASAVREPMPELDVYMGQKKGTRLAAEARRLGTYLSGEVTR